MKKKNIGKIIEIILLVAGILLTVAIVIAIPLKSYYDYEDYLAKLLEASKPEPKSVLESISVELKEGVKYFKNDLADPKPTDFIVTAHYKLDGEAYTEVVEDGKFSVSVPNDFYSVGGEISITYKKMTVTFRVELIPVTLESLTVVKNPYKVRYQTGTSFDAEGMVLCAVYNDGSTKTIPAEKYVVDTKELTLADESVTVSYTEGETTKTVAVPITVSDVLHDGAVVAMLLGGDAIVQSGNKLSDTDMEISVIYESGNRRRLTQEEYTVSGGNTVAQLGRAYNITVTYNEDSAISLATGVIVRTIVQGEDGTVFGGKVKTEAEYVVEDGVIVSLGKNTGFAGDFANGKDASVTFQLTSESETVGNFTMRCANSYCCYANGVDAAAGYVMKPLQINTIMDLIVNGQEVAIPDSLVLKGSGPHGSFAPLYNIYYDVVFENIALEPGENTIKVKFKYSTNGAANVWGQSPSTLNIDCVSFDAVGNEIPDDFVIERIEISSNYQVKVNQRFDLIKPSVYALLEDGTRIRVDQSLFDFEVAGGEEGAIRVTYGKYTITAILKSNPSVRASREIESIGVKIFNVSLEQVDDKVYYVFRGTQYGCTAEDLQFFDGMTVYDLITEINGGEIVFKIDVTLLPAGVKIYPHLKVRGVNYFNGENENGDIMGYELVFTNHQQVTLNGQVYELVRDYSMPSLKITAAN
ncbi:MAG: bacterial Ig-like domain-containing protein [Clostridia bacterium]|nr:bacterial Ig-like domain-containing protein [Clostridia bacterium]